MSPQISRSFPPHPPILGPREQPRSQIFRLQYSTPGGQSVANTLPTSRCYPRFKMMPGRKLLSSTHLQQILFQFSVRTHPVPTSSCKRLPCAVCSCWCSKSLLCKFSASCCAWALFGSYISRSCASACRHQVWNCLSMVSYTSVALYVVSADYLTSTCCASLTTLDFQSFASLLIERMCANSSSSWTKRISRSDLTCSTWASRWPSWARRYWTWSRSGWSIRCTPCYRWCQLLLLESTLTCSSSNHLQAPSLLIDHATHPTRHVVLKTAAFSQAQALRMETLEFAASRAPHNQPPMCINAQSRPGRPNELSYFGPCGN